MAHHKRGRPKNRRAGCLHCKYWKANGFKKRGRVQTRVGTWYDEYVSHLTETEQLVDWWEDSLWEEE